MRSKARLTITLNHDLLKQIDQMIDNVNVRNRSHAIELILRENLAPRVTTAVILAGGKKKGRTIPPLRQIGNTPLLLHLLNHLIGYGIETIFILAGEHKTALQAVVAEGPLLGAVIRYVDEEQPLGTAGAVKQIEDQLNHQPFLVVHGDILTNINLADFIEFHKNENTLATIAIKPRDAEKKYGKVLLQGNKITHFSETGKSEGIGLVNTGVYLLQPEALKLIESGQAAQFETDLFPKLAGINDLSAFLFQGMWFDISTPESYQMAQDRWKQDV